MKLELKNITKNFGTKKVLKDINFEVESGVSLGILGRNGAGKTTTIRILMDVFPQDEGTILVNGKEINRNELKFGYLPEERGLYPKKKVMEQLIYFTMLKGISNKDAIKSINFWLERLSMSEYKNKKLETLSKGNQQKIQLIAAIAHNPDIIVLDEPFSGLDPVNSKILKEVLKEEIKSGKIVLFSSHQMNYIEEFCDNILIINNGKVVLYGNLKEIKHNYVRDKLLVSSKDSSKILNDNKINKNIEVLNDYLLIKLDDCNSKKSVMSYLTKTYEIDEIKVYEPSLNDIFVEYTETTK